MIDMDDSNLQMAVVVKITQTIEQHINEEIQAFPTLLFLLLFLAFLSLDFTLYLPLPSLFIRGFLTLCSAPFVTLWLSFYLSALPGFGLHFDSCLFLSAFLTLDATLR